MVPTYCKFKLILIGDVVDGMNAGERMKSCFNQVNSDQSIARVANLITAHFEQKEPNWNPAYQTFHSYFDGKSVQMAMGLYTIEPSALNATTLFSVGMSRERENKWERLVLMTAS